ncbi:MAG: tetratricopeptide repeat protein [Verrucomicrobia bacterium]|nr:tetratricopeptide repeat protein [Verrucomicrobiota bacterium]
MIGSVGFYEFLAWLEENKKRLIIAAAGLVVVGSGIAIYRWNKAQTELAASQALLALRLPLNASENTPPPDASSFLKIAQAHPSTTAAQRALLLAAGTLFAEGKYAEARAQFEDFLQHFGNHPLAPSALYGKAAALESEGKSDEALRVYQEVLTRYPGAWLLADTRLAIARIHEAKKQPQLALQMYEEITRTNLMSSVSGEAMARKERLLEKHPELAKTTALTAPATNQLPIPSPMPSLQSTNAGTNAAVAPTTNAAPAANAPPANPPAAAEKK